MTAPSEPPEPILRVLPRQPERAGAVPAVKCGMVTAGSPLPRPETSFHGREREIAEITSLLQRPDARLVTLTGPGGVGKTRMAIRVAEDAWRTTADEVVFVPLASVRDPVHVASTLLRALDVREDPVDPPMATLLAALRGRRLLLVLDNLEHLAGVGAMLAEILAACPEVTLLATSRSRLRVQADHRYPVPPLPIPAADAPLDTETLGETASVALFVTRARQLVPAFTLTKTNAGAVAGICRHLDGLPLAIELAAARTPLLPPAALLSRLEDGASPSLPLLTDGADDLPPRLRTMRDAIAWSYDLLSQDEQALFRNLCVFAGGFTLAAAGSMLGDGIWVVDGADPPSPASVLDGVGSLLDKSLLVRVDSEDGEPRFGMLETIREFGLAQLVAGGEDQRVRQAHAGHFFDRTLEFEGSYPLPGFRPQLDRIEHDLPNLRAALSWLVETGQGAMAVGFAQGLGRLWWIRNRVEEGRGWLDRALAIGPDDPEPVRSRALCWAGLLAAAQGDATVATDRVEAGLAMAERLGDRRHLANAYRNAGQVAGYRGDDSTAAAYHAEAARVAREAGFSDLLPPALYELGAAHLRLGHLDQAAACSTEGLALARTIGGDLLTALLLQTLTAIAILHRRFDLAATYANEALGRALDLDDASMIAETLVGTAALAHGLGQDDQAGRLLGAASTLLEGTGRRHFRNHGQYERALVAVRTALGDARFERAWREGAAEPHAHATETARAVTTGPASVPVAAPRTAPDASTLTPREREVLALLADGLSDRGIAERLSISPWTVKRHVSHILGRLDLPNRAAAAAYAARLGYGFPAGTGPGTRPGKGEE